MIELTQGDLLKAKVEALVNAVNTVGVMGAGIALQFRQEYPAMFKVYEQACKHGTIGLGRVHLFDLGDPAACPRWVINFPTKRHWREPSRLADIEKGLRDLVQQLQRLQIRSIAVPPLGCGLGGLEWEDVRPCIERAFEETPDVHVLLFSPVQATVKG